MSSRSSVVDQLQTFEIPSAKESSSAARTRRLSQAHNQRRDDNEGRRKHSVPNPPVGGSVDWPRKDEGGIPVPSGAVAFSDHAYEHRDGPPLQRPHGMPASPNSSRLQGAPNVKAGNIRDDNPLHSGRSSKAHHRNSSRSSRSNHLPSSSPKSSNSHHPQSPRLPNTHRPHSPESTHSHNSKSPRSIKQHHLQSPRSSNSPRSQSQRWSDSPRAQSPRSAKSKPRPQQSSGGRTWDAPHLQSLNYTQADPRSTNSFRIVHRPSPSGSSSVAPSGSRSTQMILESSKDFCSRDENSNPVENKAAVVGWPSDKDDRDPAESHCQQRSIPHTGGDGKSTGMASRLSKLKTNPRQRSSSPTMTGQIQNSSGDRGDSPTTSGTQRENETKLHLNDALKRSLSDAFTVLQEERASSVATSTSSLSSNELTTIAKRALHTAHNKSISKDADNNGVSSIVSVSSKASISSTRSRLSRISAAKKRTQAVRRWGDNDDISVSASIKTVRSGSSSIPMRPQNQHQQCKKNGNDVRLGNMSIGLSEKRRPILPRGVPRREASPAKDVSNDVSVASRSAIKSQLMSKRLSHIQATARRRSPSPQCRVKSSTSVKDVSDDISVASMASERSQRMDKSLARLQVNETRRSPVPQVGYTTVPSSAPSPVKDVSDNASAASQSLSRSQRMDKSLVRIQSNGRRRASSPQLEHASIPSSAPNPVKDVSDDITVASQSLRRSQRMGERLANIQHERRRSPSPQLERASTSSGAPNPGKDVSGDVSVTPQSSLRSQRMGERLTNSQNERRRSPSPHAGRIPTLADGPKVASRNNEGPQVERSTIPSEVSKGGAVKVNEKAKQSLRREESPTSTLQNARSNRSVTPPKNDGSSSSSAVKVSVTVTSSPKNKARDVSTLPSLRAKSPGTQRSSTRHVALIAAERSKFQSSNSVTQPDRDDESVSSVKSNGAKSGRSRREAFEKGKNKKRLPVSISPSFSLELKKVEELKKKAAQRTKDASPGRGARLSSHPAFTRKVQPDLPRAKPTDNAQAADNTWYSRTKPNRREELDSGAKSSEHATKVVPALPKPNHLPDQPLEENRSYRKVHCVDSSETDFVEIASIVSTASTGTDFFQEVLASEKANLENVQAAVSVWHTRSKEKPHLHSLIKAPVVCPEYILNPPEDPIQFLKVESSPTSASEHGNSIQSNSVFSLESHEFEDILSMEADTFAATKVTRTKKDTNLQVAALTKTAALEDVNETTLIASAEISQPELRLAAANEMQFEGTHHSQNAIATPEKPLAAGNAYLTRLENATETQAPIASNETSPDAQGTEDEESLIKMVESIESAKANASLEKPLAARDAYLAHLSKTTDLEDDLVSERAVPVAIAATSKHYGGYVNEHDSSEKPLVARNAYLAHLDKAGSIPFVEGDIETEQAVEYITAATFKPNECPGNKNYEKHVVLEKAVALGARISCDTTVTGFEAPRDDLIDSPEALSSSEKPLGVHNAYLAHLEQKKVIPENLSSIPNKPGDYSGKSRVTTALAAISPVSPEPVAQKESAYEGLLSDCESQADNLDIASHAPSPSVQKLLAKAISASGARLEPIHGDETIRHNVEQRHLDDQTDASLTMSIDSSIITKASEVTHSLYFSESDNESAISAMSKNYFDQKVESPGLLPGPLPEDCSVHYDDEDSVAELSQPSDSQTMDQTDHEGSTLIGQLHIKSEGSDESIDGEVDEAIVLTLPQTALLSPPSDTKKPRKASRAKKALNWWQKNYSGNQDQNVNQIVENSLTPISLTMAATTQEKAEDSQHNTIHKRREESQMVNSKGVSDNKSIGVYSDEESVFSGLDDMTRSESFARSPASSIVSRQKEGEENKVLLAAVSSADLSGRSKFEIVSAKSFKSKNSRFKEVKFIGPPAPPPQEHFGEVLDELQLVDTVSSDITTSVIAAEGIDHVVDWSRQSSLKITEELSEDIAAENDTIKIGQPEEQVEAPHGKTKLHSRRESSTRSQKKKKSAKVAARASKVARAVEPSARTSASAARTAKDDGTPCFTAEGTAPSHEEGDAMFGSAVFMRIGATILDTFETVCRVHDEEMPATRANSKKARFEVDISDAHSIAESAISQSTLNDREAKKWEEWDRRETQSVFTNSTVDSRLAENNTDAESFFTDNDTDVDSRFTDVFTDSESQAILTDDSSSTVYGRQAAAHQKLVQYTQSAMSSASSEETFDDSRTRESGAETSTFGPSSDESSYPDASAEKEAIKNVRNKPRMTVMTDGIPTNGSNKPPTHKALPSALSLNQSRILDKFCSSLKNQGIEILKQNRDSKWQARYLTVSKELVDIKHIKTSSTPGNKGGGAPGRCPSALLWLKRFNSQSKGYSMALIDKQGKGGVHLSQLVKVTATGRSDPAHQLPKKFRDKFKDSVTVILEYTLGGTVRSMAMRCKTTDEAHFFCTGMRVCMDILKRDKEANSIIF